MRVSGILHVSILIGDVARAQSFYSDILGLPLAERPELGFPGVWYRLDDQRELHLMRLPNPDAAASRPEHGGRDRHLAFSLDRLDELALRLEQAGIAYTRSRSGRAALFCRDPDGNALEFVERGAS